MRLKAILLIALGILGGIFISVFDIIMGKPVNDITGPKSISALIVCGFFIIDGMYMLMKGAKKH
ncbi:MAG: hypothetical protein V1893_00760 [Candidatus Omnitrophota bacterium]